jgi:hypothetical protein
MYVVGRLKEVSQLKRANTLLTLVAAIASVPLVASAANSADYAFTVNGTWEVPQATLPAGKYIITVRDQLLDRHIFQIRDASGKVYSTFLAVPYHGGAVGDPFSFWNGSGATKVVRTWKPANEDQSWELVYPKDRAVQIATDAKTSVPAVILPDSLTSANPFLSDRDMQSIQMWMLTPKRVGGNLQMAVAKIGRTAPPAPQPTVASAAGAETQRMPKTASGFADSIFCGTMLLMFGGMVAFSTRRPARSAARR